MSTLTRTLLLAIALAALACAGTTGVPSPDAPDAKKKAHCEAISADKSVGCKACAGVEFCAWKQTSSPVDGTCHYVEGNSADPAMITDPNQCPKPPE
jgi:hypothetical protein